MRIAVTYENGQVFPHFGHTETFMIYDIENGRIAHKTLMPTNGSGHGALAGFLESMGVDMLICGGIGGGAQAALMECGIMLYAGVSGDADAAVEALLNGTLRFFSGATCSHHGEGHTCGEHSCGHEQGDADCGAHHGGCSCG